MMNCITGSSSALGNYLKSGRRISSGETGKTVELSSEDMRVIRKSWDGVKDKRTLGQKIFFLILTTKPELQPLFKIKCGNAVELMQHPKLLRHAEVFVNFLHTIVTELYDEEGPNEHIVQIVRAAGIAHCSVRSMSFTAENWLVFKSTICEVMGKTESASGKAYMAWNKLLTFIISEMKDAYLYGVRRNTWPGQETTPVTEGTTASTPLPASPIPVDEAEMPQCPFPHSF